MTRPFCVCLNPSELFALNTNNRTLGGFALPRPLPGHSGCGRP